MHMQLQHITSTTFTEEQVAARVAAETAELQMRVRALQNENVDLEGRCATAVRIRCSGTRLLRGGLFVCLFVFFFFLVGWLLACLVIFYI